MSNVLIHYIFQNFTCNWVVCLARHFIGALGFFGVLKYVVRYEINTLSKLFTAIYCHYQQMLINIPQNDSSSERIPLSTT